MKYDINTSQDVKKLVDSFYDKVKTDDLIGHIFTKVASVNWEVHLPRMYTFWEAMVLGTIAYTGNAMDQHYILSKKTPLEKEHFDRWMHLWIDNANNLFFGPNTDKAIEKAQQVADLMVFKIAQINSKP
ncbi:MAG: group III truncated hemoglobin [Flavobacteriales bacterium]|nr:group III truncated hemoglobin [Flavobacteriales bacterium]